MSGIRDGIKYCVHIHKSTFSQLKQKWTGSLTQDNLPLSFFYITQILKYFTRETKFSNNFKKNTLFFFAESTSYLLFWQSSSFVSPISVDKYAWKVRTFFLICFTEFNSCKDRACLFILSLFSVVKFEKKMQHQFF